MFEQIINFFRHKDWSFTQIKDKTIVILGISGKNGKFQLVADIRESEKQIAFFTICGINTPENKKPEICALLTRLNFGKFLGNFEMDYDDGEIRYKTSMYYGDIKLDDDVIERLVMTNIMTMDISLPSIMSLIYGDISPVEAYNLTNRE
jgi:hypothetical protein